MSVRASDDSAIRALRALSREAAEAQVPAVDWDRVEQGLFAEIVGGDRPAPLEALALPAPTVPPRRVGSPWTAALTAAAAIALFAGVWHVESSAPSRGSDRAARTPLSVHGITLGDSLVAGDVVESKGRALAYEKRGLVTFTVAPSSRVKLVAAEQIGDGPGAVTISLAEGSVHAEVEPQPEGEAFAVEVGRTRVAVHGTSFTVSREGDRVKVEVAHGSVAVGPASHRGSTQGWLLVGPDQAMFSLDGAREAQWLAASASDSVRAAASRPERPFEGVASSPDPTSTSRRPSMGAAPSSMRAGHVVARGESAAHSADDATDKQIPAADAPTQAPGVATLHADQDEAATASILSGIESCYERQVSSFGVTFSVRSSLTLSIQPNGTIREGVFNPPLSPTLMSCAQEAITASRFPKGMAVREIRVPVTLSRP
jgi:hypothetical protein